MSWQVQEAKQQFSEVLRRARYGPQTITRHGKEIAVVLDINEYRRLAGTAPDLKKLLLDGPPHSDDFAEVMDEVIAERQRARYREIDFGE